VGPDILHHPNVLGPRQTKEEWSRLPDNVVKVTAIAPVVITDQSQLDLEDINPQIFVTPGDTKLASWPTREVGSPMVIV